MEKSRGLPLDPRARCWLEKLQIPEADDRVIPWSRICPHAGPDELENSVCKYMSVGEPALEPISSAGHVEPTNASLERKFIVHVRSDLIRKNLLAGDADPKVLVEHLNALARDVGLADSKLASGEYTAKGYAGIKEWIDHRKQNPNSLYACGTECKLTSMDVVDPRIDLSAQQSLLRKLRKRNPEPVRAEASAMIQAIKNETLAGILHPFRTIPKKRAAQLGVSENALIPEGRLSTCVTDPETELPLIVYSAGKLTDAQIDQALSEAWAECGLPTPLPPCDYEVVLKPEGCNSDQECRDQKLGWVCVDRKCEECTEHKHCEEQGSDVAGPLCDTIMNQCFRANPIPPPPSCMTCNPLEEYIDHRLKRCPNGYYCSKSTHCCKPFNGKENQCANEAVSTYRTKWRKCKADEVKEIEKCAPIILKCTVQTARGKPDPNACPVAAKCAAGGPKLEGDACRAKAYKEYRDKLKTCDDDVPWDGD